MDTRQTYIPIDLIDFDKENPRIKVSLEKYRDEINEARIGFALRSSMDDFSLGTSSFNSLKSSIRAADGITVPITVYKSGDRYICIDGNTRLLIYHDLAENNVPGNWKSIRALILNKPGEKEINTVRITAHLVGARQWPAYEKARYLHELHYVYFMDYDQLIATCGGNRKQIDQQIQAYHDMNEYYRIPNPDDAFKMDRFSGFLELQKPKIKEAIFEAGFELQDFGNWIRDGNIYRLEDVRKLPKVLSDNEAKEKLVTGGVRSIEAAVKIVENKLPINGGRPLKETRIGDASLGDLTEALLDKINTLPRNEFMALRNSEDETARETTSALSDLVESLNSLLQDV